MLIIEEVLGAFGGPVSVRFCVPVRDFAQDLAQAVGGLEGSGVAQRPIHPYSPWIGEKSADITTHGGAPEERQPSIIMSA